MQVWHFLEKSISFHIFQGKKSHDQTTEMHYSCFLHSIPMVLVWTTGISRGAFVTSAISISTITSLMAPERTLSRSHNIYIHIYIVCRDFKSSLAFPHSAYRVNANQRLERLWLHPCRPPYTSSILRRTLEPRNHTSSFQISSGLGFLPCFSPILERTHLVHE